MEMGSPVSGFFADDDLPRALSPRGKAQNRKIAAAINKYTVNGMVVNLPALISELNSGIASMVTAECDELRKQVATEQKALLEEKHRSALHEQEQKQHIAQLEQIDAEQKALLEEKQGNALLEQQEHHLERLRLGMDREREALYQVIRLLEEKIDGLKRELSVSQCQLQTRSFIELIAELVRAADGSSGTTVAGDVHFLTAKTVAKLMEEDG
jgi:hypothetical protein